MATPENDSAENLGNLIPASGHDDVQSPPTGILAASRRGRAPDLSTTAKAGGGRSRHKVSRACDRCKVKKLRCTGTIPCDHCSKRGIECLYDSDYRRGRPPTPPASGTSRASAPVPVAEASPITPASEPRLQTRKRQRSQRTNPLSQEPSKHRRMPDAPVGSGLGSRASPEHETAEIEGQFFDTTSNLTFLHRAWKRFSQDSPRRTEATGGTASHMLADAEQFQGFMSAGDRPMAVDPGQPLVMPDRETAHQLFEFYFDQCVATYRCLHRQTCFSLLEVVLDNASKSLPLSYNLGSSNAAIILTILAIAKLRKDKIFGVSDSLSPVFTSDHPLRSCSDQYFCEGMKFTNGELGLPRLSSVQTRVLQILYLLQTGRMNHAWYLFGVASSVVAAIGLHRKASRSRHGPDSNLKPDYIADQCARRTFWVVYIIDKYLSVALGRPRLWNDDDITQQYPDCVNDEDMGHRGPASSTPNLDCHIDALIAHAKISSIIENISREVYSLKSITRRERLAAAQRFCTQLHEWQQSLPAHLGSIRPQSLIPSFRRQAIALKLAYCHALIHANRPFMLGSGDGSNTPAQDDTVAECINAARMTLQTMIDLVKDGMLFHAFWWTPYVAFCAIAVVYVCEIQQKADGTDISDDPSLFELAERCHSHLASSPSTYSPGPKYSVILEELRLEAKQGAVTENPNPHGPSADGGIASSEVSRAPGDLQQSSREVNLDLNLALDDVNAASFPPFDDWHVADWLDLDSSAYNFGSLQWTNASGNPPGSNQDWEANVGG